MPNAIALRNGPLQEPLRADDGSQEASGLQDRLQGVQKNVPCCCCELSLKKCTELLLGFMAALLASFACFTVSEWTEAYGVDHWGNSDTSSFCPKFTGSTCAVSGFLSQFGLGVACYGNLTCVEGICLCGPDECVGPDGHCFRWEHWRRGFVGQNVKLQAMEHPWHYMNFNTAIGGWDISSNNQSNGTSLDFFKLPGGARSHFLLGTSQESAHLIAPSQPVVPWYIWRPKFYWRYGDVFINKRAAYVSKSQILKKMTYLAMSNQTLQVEINSITAGIQIKNAHGSCLVYQTLELFHKGDQCNCLGNNCEMECNLEFAGEFQGDFQATGGYCNWCGEGNACCHSGPLFQNKARVKHGPCIGQHLGNVDIDIPWIIDMVCVSTPPLRWGNCTSTASWWSLQTNTTSIHDFQLEWDLPKPAASLNSEPQTCAEKKALGPREHWTTVKLWDVEVWPPQNVVNSFLGYAVQWSVIMLCVLACVCCCNLLCGDRKGKYCLLAAAICYLLGVVPCLSIAVLMSLVVFAMMPLMEANSYMHYERNIAFCIGEIGITWTSFPIYTLLTLSNLHSMCTAKRGPDDPDTFWYVFKTSVTGTWRVGQAIDLFIDIGTFVSACLHMPLWYTICWGLCTLSSIAQLVCNVLGFWTLQFTLKVGFWSEHIGQFILSTTALSSKTMDEFVAFSAINSFMSLIKFSLTCMLTKASARCTDATESSFGDSQPDLCN